MKTDAVVLNFKDFITEFEYWRSQKEILMELSRKSSEDWRRILNISWINLFTGGPKQILFDIRYAMFNVFIFVRLSYLFQQKCISLVETHLHLYSRFVVFEPNICFTQDIKISSYYLFFENNQGEIIHCLFSNLL